MGEAPERREGRGREGEDMNRIALERSRKSWEKDEKGLEVVEVRKRSKGEVTSSERET